MTRSARFSTSTGMVNPRSRAALTLSESSRRVMTSTGKSPGLLESRRAHLSRELQVNVLRRMQHVRGPADDLVW
jgi:hypothetical protein